tara:strand:+ start:338 stop:961 length:624 start_codon:yes stop_codon:yes gene_type:complete
MKTLFFALVALGACGPTEVDVSNETVEQAIGSKDHTGSSHHEEATAEGVIGADDCQHVDLGDKACNFTLYDQDENVWELYEHAGDVIVIDFSTSWCPPCQAAGYYTQQLQDDYSSQGVQIVTILIDGPTGGIAPTQEDINIWVADHGINTAPVLMGSRDLMFDPTAVNGYSIGAFPTYLYLDRNMNFYAAHAGFSDAYIREKIEEAL